ncbi:MAG: hypothetical protein IPJ06_14280 [Saprospiraceae bacterium]|nr:hypothetical protein [Saprospiraceae bacterium]
MKLIRTVMFFGLAIIFTLPVQAQNLLQRPKNPDFPGRYGGGGILSKLSATATVGSGWMNGGASEIGDIGIGEVTVSYALIRAMDVGVSAGGSLLCNPAFIDESGAIVSTVEDPLGTECTESWAIAQTFSVLARYFPLPAYPAFAQFNGGYSRWEAPFVGISVGYGQRVYSSLSVVAPARYATLLGSEIDFVQTREAFGWSLVWPRNLDGIPTRLIFSG